MRDLLRRYRTLLAVAAALLVPLASLYLHGRARERPLTPIEIALSAVATPMQQAAGGAVAAVLTLWEGYVDLVHAKRDLERAEADKRVLLGEAMRAKKLQRENERLRAALGFKDAHLELHVEPARVLGKDVSPYYTVVKVTLDVVGTETVDRGQPVITHEGVVGRVAKVASGAAEVMLATDPRSRIDVKVPAKGITGYLQGGGEARDYRARLRYLHKGEPVEVGDLVVTSGHDKVFPAELVVGIVGTAEPHQDGLYYEVEVDPSVNFSTLEEVLVVTGRGAPEGAPAEGAP